MSRDNPTPIETIEIYEYHLPIAPAGERFGVSIPAMRMMIGEYRRLEAAHAALVKELVELKEHRMMGRPPGRPRKEVANAEADA